MSWDVILMKSKIDLAGNDTDPGVLGNKADVIKAITSILPDVDYTDPSWGVFYNGTTSIEFNTGDNETVETLMLHVRGGGNPLMIINTICEETGWAALDTSTAEFINKSAIIVSWQEFSHYRDQIIDNKNGKI